MATIGNFKKVGNTFQGDIMTLNQEACVASRFRGSALRSRFRIS